MMRWNLLLAVCVSWGCAGNGEPQASSCEDDPTQPACVVRDTDPADDTDDGGDGDAGSDTDALDDTDDGDVDTDALDDTDDGDGDTDAAGTASLNEVRIEPTVAYNDDVLRCAVEVDDPNGDALLVRLWTRVASGAELGTGEFLDLSAGSLLAPGEVVRCRATLVHGGGDEVDSAVVLLSNRAPVVTSVVVSPPSPVRGDVVTCAAEATDADGDAPVLSYAWSTGAVGPSVTVSASEPRGTALVCTATATDALDGALTDSETGSVTVANTPPVVTSVVVSPPSPVRGDVVTCAAEASDADGDAPVLSYAWSTGAVGPSVTVSASEPQGTVLVCTVTATDALDGALTDSGTGSVTVANTPPVVTSVTVSPSTARVGDVVTCAAEAVDADDDALTLSYAWSNGATGSSLTLLSSDNPGTALLCTATATDPQDASDSLTSTAGVTVANTPPVVTSVVVSPASPARGDTVTCVAEATDADGDDPVLSYAWSTGAVGPSVTVSASEPRGTALVCTATATDALDASLTDSGTGSVEVGNTPPVVAHVGIAPEVARTQDVLTAVVEASDVDGDDLSFGYVWQVNGGVVPGEEGSALGSSHFVKGDAVVLSVTADDGSAASDGVSSPRVVANTAPGAPVVAVTPADAVEVNALTCAVVTAAVDPDVDDGADTLTYSFSWTVGGSAFPGATDSALSSVVSGDDVGPEELWVCEAVANDGEDAGDVGTAEVFVEAWVPPDPGGALTTARLGVVRYIPAGSFTMGCVQGRDSVAGVVCDPPSSTFTGWQLPTRTVTLTQGFWMMESELTQGMWTGLGFANPSSFSGTNHPVETVNWWEALEAANETSRRDGLAECYALTGCNSNAVGSNRRCTGVTVTSASGHPKDCEGWRLPTEAEWEYAARAGTNFPYSGGSDVSQVAWYSGNNSPSGTKADCTTPTPRNAWGLCDMSGNVWEWTWDGFASSYAGAATTDPAGLGPASWRMARGGSWGYDALDVRVARRARVTPGSRFHSIGFRLVRSFP